MARFTQDELKKRAFYRVAWVLWHFWEEQKDEIPRGGKADIHSRLFDTLVHRPLIHIGKSIEGGGHIEHLVPCALIRDHAFAMFHDEEESDTESTIKKVAEMIGRYLRVADITREEAKKLDHVLGLKTTMPADWDFATGSVMRRLEEAGIELLD